MQSNEFVIDKEPVKATCSQHLKNILSNPVVGKNVGEIAEFGGLLGYAPIIPVNEFDCSNFVNRQGRIPAPIHSFKN